ncbi:hypothetical protein HK100_012467, partial [Physocladia obscura]
MTVRIGTIKSCGLTWLWLYNTDPKRFQNSDQETEFFKTLPYGADNEKARPAKRSSWRSTVPQGAAQDSAAVRRLNVSPAEQTSISDASAMRNAPASDWKISCFKDRLLAAPSIVSVNAEFSSNISSTSDAAFRYATSIHLRMTNAL